MSIPLDRLYHFIDNIAKEIADNILIYRFYPHGSKKLENLEEIHNGVTFEKRAKSILLICHDQEPLNYNLYQHLPPKNDFQKLLKSLSLYDENTNFNCKQSMYNRVLLHSEQRSVNLITYQNDHFITVYYWCHALLALDWYRFANYICQKKNVTKKFLIYNRAWSGTREYRLKFAELLIRLELDNDCKMSINPVEPELGIHYGAYKFANPLWQPTQVLENYFPISTAHSHYSADFDIEDYNATDIEIVLETLFDDSRLHLTEKSLRPIAVGQPFILAGTHGSLEYLRSYGFITFNEIWDESYDLIKDPEERLTRIADLMRQIANWAPEVKEKKLAEAQAIAEYNRQRFFSQDFFNQVINELKTNLLSAAHQTHKINSAKLFIDRWEHYLTFQEIRNFLESNKPDHVTTTQLENALKIAKDLHQQHLNKQQN
jgi:hypothetical protein